MTNGAGAPLNARHSRGLMTTRLHLPPLRAIPAIGVAAATMIGVAACGGSSDSTNNPGAGSSGAAKGSTTLNLVGYSTPKAAYDALTSAFARTPAGKGVTFAASFGSSGSQSRAVDSGQPADVVAFSTTPDMTRLVKDKIVASNWNANPEHGFSSDSVVVFVVRRGNPKHISSWSDLVRPGISVITPNPATSGSARWNVLAGYGAMLKQGKSPAAALAYLKTLITKHVSDEPASASDALAAFTGGKGDVLRDYEVQARRAGEGVPQLPVVEGRADDLGAAGLPPGRLGGRQAVRHEVPDPAAAVHDRLPGRVDGGRRRVLRPEQGIDHQARAGRRVSHCLQLGHPSRRPPRRLRSPRLPLGQERAARALARSAAAPASASAWQRST